MPLQVRDERLADRGQLAQARGSRQGRLHDLFVEDPGRFGHGGQLELLPGVSGARRARPADLAPAEGRGEGTGGERVQSVLGGQ